MGGRRSYSLEDVFGRSKKTRQDKRRVTRAVKEGRADRISSDSAQLVLDSERPVRLLSEAVRAYSKVLAEARKGEPKTYEERKRAANKAWAVERDKRGIQTSLIEDKIVTEALARALRRRKRGK